MNRTGKRKVLTIVICDLVCFLLFCGGVCAIVFDFFGGDKSLMDSAVSLSTPTPAPSAAPTEAPSSTPEAPLSTEDSSVPSENTPEPTQAPTPEPTGLLKDKYAELFTAGEPVLTDTSYSSDDIAINLTVYDGAYCASCGHVSQTSDVCSLCGASLNKGAYLNYTIADIYIQSIDCLRSFAASKASEVAHVKAILENEGGILGINSDYYMNSKQNKHGWFVRNYVEIARFSKISSDLCILYADGVMDTVDIKTDTYDVDEIYSNYPYQIWYFGPALLTKDGQPKTSFSLHGSISGANPRTIIGYYEPGHYCFIVVNGTRDSGSSRGLSLEELSQFCADLSLTAAYNLDGGASTAMVFNGVVYGHAGRGTSDIIYIGEPAE